MSVEQVTFRSSDNLSLEGFLHLPPERGGLPGVVVCHPHPLYGGNMHNLVVAEICRCLNDQDIAALRFNFRGTGASEGRHTDGVHEPDDVMGALSYLESLERVDGGRLGVVGYSFGAFAGTKGGAADPRARAICGIAPPILLVDMSFLKASSKPKLFIFGSRDEITPLGPFMELFSELPGENRYEVLEGADHFLFGYEERAAELVAGFFAERLVGV